MFSNTPKFFATLQPLPEVICVEKPRQPFIQIHHVCLTLIRIPHNDLGVFPIAILLRIHTKFLIYLQLQAILIIHHAPPRSISAVHALQLKFLQARLQVRKLGGEALRLDLEIVGGFGNAEFLCVKSCDLGRVCGGRVRGRGFAVVVFKRRERS